MDNFNSVTDRIKKHSIKIEWDDKIFTGCIINPNSHCSYLYVLTAAHCFKSKDHDFDQNEISIQPERISNIKLYYNDGTLISYSEILLFFTSKDLCLFFLPKELYKFNLDKAIIHNSINYDHKEFHMVGYPKIWDHKLGYFRLTHAIIDKDYLIKFQEQRSLYNIKALDSVSKALNGLSGSGAFYINRDNDLELLGIHIESEDVSILISIDLSYVIDELNNIICIAGKNLNSNLFPIYIDDKISVENQNLLMGDICLDEFKEHIGFPTVEALPNNFIEEVAKSYSNHTKESKKLAKDLAKVAIFYKHKGDNKKSRDFFKKSIAMNPDYKKYFLATKNTRTDNSVKREIILESLSNYEKELNLYDLKSKLDDFDALFKYSYETEHPIYLIEIIKSIFDLILKINQHNKNLPTGLSSKITLIGQKYILKLQEILENFYSINYLLSAKMRYISEKPYLYAAEVYYNYGLYTFAYAYYRATIELIKRNNDLNRISKISAINDKIFKPQNENRELIGLLTHEQINYIENDVYTKIETLYSDFERATMIDHLRLDLHEDNIDECIDILKAVKEKINTKKILHNA